MIHFECQSNFRSRLYLFLAGFGTMGLLLAIYTLTVNYLSVSGHGNWGVPGQEIVVWLSLLGIIIMAVCLVGLLFSRTRCTSMALMAGSGLFVALSIFSLKTADNIRQGGFERLAREAAPLVAAIHDHVKEHGSPPEDLREIQVIYPADHIIKGGVLPKFSYIKGEQAMERYHGNSWVLMLKTPTGPLRWDVFLYYPQQNYPSLGHGGWLERIGEWAYVHE